jgi:hypothetical protein
MEIKMPEETTDAPSVVESDEVAETPDVKEAVDESPTTEADGEKAETDPYAEVEDLDSTSPDETEEVDEPAEGEAEGEETEAESGEVIEFNFGGNSLEVKKGDLPAELEAKVQQFADNTWSDYTKGKQANAEAAKENTASRDAIAKMTTLNGEALQTYSHGLSLRQEIAELSQYDIQSMWQSNPDQARQLTDTLAKKQGEFQQIVAHVNQQEQAMDEAQKHENARLVETGKATLDRQIKDFSTKVAPEVVDYVVKNGMSQADAEQWATNPQLTTYAYKAMLYDRMQAAPTKAKVAPTQAKPMTAMKSTGKASSSNDPNSMSTEQYAKWRKAGNG